MVNEIEYTDSFIYKLFENEELAISFAQYKGLLPRSIICYSMIITYTYRCNNKTNGYYFRCVNDNCHKELSIRKSSFFERSRLRIGQILVLMFYLSKGETKITSLKRETLILGNTAIIDWLSYCREICTIFFLRNPVILGGIGVVVEIVETLMVRRKGQHGRIPREQWVFCGYAPDIKEGFLTIVPDRTKETLIPIIKRHILLGSTIYSDEARVYACLNNEGYIHKTVNHSIGQWVDFQTGCTTNRVESFWSRVKMHHKERKGTNRSTLESHLSEFMWREKFKNSFNIFLSHVRDVYGFN